jgi:anti-sigma B factor antagonist
MEIQVKTMKRCEWVSVAGEIGNDVAPQLEARLLALIEAGGRNLVLNLRQVTFLSSGGLRALMVAQMAVRRKAPRGQVVISEPSPLVKNTLEMVGFHHLFELFEEDVQAVDLF